MSAAAPTTEKDPAPGDVKVVGRLDGNCIHCKVAMGAFLGMNTPEGPIHNDCIPAYKRGRVERCGYCDNVLKATRTIIGGVKVHPECLADYKVKKPYEPPMKEGVLSKMSVGRSFFGKKDWKERYFALSKAGGLAYYENQQSKSQGKAPKGAVAMLSDTRMVTHPTKNIYKEASNPSTEILIIFREDGTERKLLLAAKNYQEHDEWTAALECYIKFVDDPRDLVE